MAEEKKAKKDNKPKDKPDAKASAKPPKKEKAEKAEKVEKVEKVEAPPPPPREPADPRLKYIKKFHGRFLPKGTLRDRHKAIIARWDSGEDHGGVTVDELKSLFTDWRATRASKKTSTTA